MPSETSIQAPPPETTSEEKTLQQIKATECWLLVADIEGSTRILRKSSDTGVPPATNEWLDDCKRLIEKHGGSINKFLGDGFFAYWRHGTGAEEQVARTLETLTQMQGSANMAFRVVLHFGQVFTGGAASLGEESLQGKEVHFIFRMEKLAGAIGERCLISEAAKAPLAARLLLTGIGNHPVSGFDGEYAFHTLAR